MKDIKIGYFSTYYGEFFISPDPFFMECFIVTNPIPKHVYYEEGELFYNVKGWPKKFSFKFKHRKATQYGVYEVIMKGRNIYLKALAQLNPYGTGWEGDKIEPNRNQQKQIL